MKPMYPQYLVETDWLERNLDNPDLRILDCTVLFQNDPNASWENGHIPGSGHVDLVQELSDQASPYPFMLPPAVQFTTIMSRYGIEDGKFVVLYDSCNDKWASIWAARVWWMLRVYGFDQASVLNGGWHKWRMESRPVSTAPCVYASGNFIPRFRPDLIAHKDEVLQVIRDGHACLINALTPEEHAGKKSKYGRPGHIPTSINVPTTNLIDPITHTYLPMKKLREHFFNILGCDRIITYCGGGIAASSDAFILTLLGAKDVAVYDGSLFEWASDPSLPMEIDKG